jgi:hypothetical protein
MRSSLAAVAVCLLAVAEAAQLKQKPLNEYIQYESVPGASGSSLLFRSISSYFRLFLNSIARFHARSINANPFLW